MPKRMDKLQASFRIYCQDPSNYCFIARTSATSFFIGFARTSETAFSHQTAESDQQKSNFVSFDININILTTERYELM